MNKMDIFNEIIEDEKFKRERKYIQHGDMTVYEHSIEVAKTCVRLAEKLNLKVSYKELIKGALLHDYFLYDWHIYHPSHKLHGFTHPKVARDNAKRDFGLTKKEENMILTHMFPLVPRPPKYKESILLCLVDKYCATKETLSRNKILRKIKKVIYNTN